MDLNGQTTNGDFKTEKSNGTEPVVRYDHFSKEVIERIKEAFKVFDKNGDGRITAEELLDVIHSLMIPQTTTWEEADKMIKEADKDGNGSVEFEEFCVIMNRYVEAQEPNEDAEAWEAFQLFDHDKNGFIDKDELKETMNRLGESLTDEDVQAMICSAARNHLGRIDFADFKHMMFERKREASVSSASSAALDSSANASGRASPQPVNHSLTADMNVPDSTTSAKRKHSSGSRLFAKTSTGERPSDLLNVNTNSEKKEKQRRPSWTGLRNLLKK